MLNRTVKSRARGSSVQLIDCLKSLFVLELLQPSEELYLISPWLSKVPLIDNRFGQFRAISGDYDKAELNLADTLILLAQRGTKVHILYRRPANEMTHLFIESVRDIRRIECRSSEELHEKGLITSHFYLRGSMNFTYAGININDEHVELTTDEAMIWKALQEAKIIWEGEAAHGDSEL
jgi:hypothetical protein